MRIHSSKLPSFQSSRLRVMTRVRSLTTRSAMAEAKKAEDDDPCYLMTYIFSIAKDHSKHSARILAWKVRAPSVKSAQQAEHTCAQNGKDKIKEYVEGIDKENRDLGLASILNEVDREGERWMMDFEHLDDARDTVRVLDLNKRQDSIVVVLVRCVEAGEEVTLIVRRVIRSYPDDQDQELLPRFDKALEELRAVKHV